MYVRVCMRSDSLMDGIRTTTRVIHTFVSLRVRRRCSALNETTTNETIKDEDEETREECLCVYKLKLVESEDDDDDAAD